MSDWEDVVAKLNAARTSRSDIPDQVERRLAFEAKPSEVVKKPTKPSAVKPATPDLNMKNILETSGYEQEEYAQMIMNDIGGRELSIVSRVGALNGMNIQYQPITDLAFTVLRGNSLNIQPNPNSKSSYFDVVSLDLDEFTPTRTELAAEGYDSVVYFNSADGSIVINLKDISTELVEIEFIKIESVNDDTIYYGDKTNYSS